jgi:hypothetical protein
MIGALSCWFMPGDEVVRGALVRGSVKEKLVSLALFRTIVPVLERSAGPGNDEMDTEAGMLRPGWNGRLDQRCSGTAAQPLSAATL